MKPLLTMLLLPVANCCCQLLLLFSVVVVVVGAVSSYRLGAWTRVVAAAAAVAVAPFGMFRRSALH